MSKARSLWRVAHPNMPFPGPAGTIDQVREWIRLRSEQKDHPRDAALYSIERVPTCGCCGTEHGIIGIHQGRIAETADAYRCEKHADRNPCMFDGCGRTFANDGDYRTQFVCGKHFRMAPLSLRQGLKRIKRLGDKHDWPDTLRKRYSQLWDRIVRDIRAALAGDIDVAEINRVMGWD